MTLEPDMFEVGNRSRELARFTVVLTVHIWPYTTPTTKLIPEPSIVLVASWKKRFVKLLKGS